jgi:hypothetical protein
MASQSFYTVVSEAIRHFEQNGFTSAEDLSIWTERIRKAAVDSLTPESVLNDTLTRTLGGIYKRLVDDGQLLKANPGIPKYTIERLKPKLRTELDRRMMVSRSLIKLNRQQSVEKTIQRFAGWASSVPAGGSRAVDVKDTKDHIRKALTSLSFEDRRVAIDQSAKFTAALNEIVAVDGGAIALIWRSMWRRPGYAYREDHKERDGLIYTIRDNWAIQKGLMKVGDAGYYDQVTAVGQEVFCSCFAQFLFNLRDLPESMLTIRGKESLEAVRAKIKAMT